MTVKKVKVGGLKRPDARLDVLRHQLVEEWQRDEATGNTFPEILEETDPAGRVVHVYVIWDEWRDLDQQQRSELITDAFIAVRGQAAILDLTVAMGLTPEEAKRMGLA